MHAALARMTSDIAYLIHHQPAPWDRVTGTLLAKGIAKAAEVGYLALKAKGVLVQQELAKNFFEENLVIEKPSNGVPLYQGRFLLRTLKPEDDLNVLISFCPEPDLVYEDDGDIDPCRVVKAEALTEPEADRIEGDPDKVDLVIRFKDASSIVSLFEQKDLDMVGLLLDNVVQLDGNIGHLFKLGAIAADITRIIAL